MDFLGIGWGEILLILIVALLVFGPGKMVEVAKTLGKTVNAFKKAAGEFTSQVSKELEEEKKQLEELKKESQTTDPAKNQDNQGMVGHGK